MVYSLSAGMIARLQKYFPDRWADLYALSVARIMDHGFGPPEIREG